MFSDFLYKFWFFFLQNWIGEKLSCHLQSANFLVRRSLACCTASDGPVCSIYNNAYFLSFIRRRSILRQPCWLLPLAFNWWSMFGRLSSQSCQWSLPVELHTCKVKSTTKRNSDKITIWQEKSNNFDHKLMYDALTKCSEHQWIESRFVTYLVAEFRSISSQCMTCEGRLRFLVGNLRHVGMACVLDLVRFP